MNDKDLEVMVEAAVAAFKRQFVEADGTMLMRLEQPTQFMQEWLTEHITQMARAYGDERERRGRENVATPW